MHETIQVGICVFIFYAGVALGFFFKQWLLYRSGFDGAILVLKDGDKILYSIELHDEVELIEYKKELILKVKLLPKEL